METFALIKSNKLFEDTAVEKINFSDMEFAYDNFEAGDLIYKRKTETEFLYLILEGEVVLIRPEGKTLLKEGDFFGTAIIKDEFYNEIAVCEADCFLVKISKSELEKLISIDKQIRKNILDASNFEPSPADEEKAETKTEECPPCPEPECPEPMDCPECEKCEECPEYEEPQNVLTYEEAAEKFSSAILPEAEKALEILSQLEEKEENPKLLEIEKNIRKIYEEANVAGLFTNNEEFSEKKTYSVLDLINEFLERFSVEYSFYKCEIKVENEESYKVNVDRKKLYQAVKQILINACESTGFSGKVSIEISTDADYVELIFTDNGNGIPPERSLDVFEPFVSFDKQNLGLGLAVADKIIREQTGKITVKQKNSEGASISIYLPIVKDEE